MKMGAFEKTVIIMVVVAAFVYWLDLSGGCFNACIACFALYKANGRAE